MRLHAIPLALALAASVALTACGGGGKQGSGSLPGNGLIAFMLEDGDDWDIHVMNADGTGKHRLLADRGLEGLPDWSPDGTKLAFARQRNSGVDVYVADSDGTHEQRLTTDGGSNWPIWSPDGKTVAVRRNDDARSLYLVASDGSASRKIAAGLWPNAGVSWSPDSRRLAIVVGEPEGSGVIQLVDAESGDKTALEQADSTVTWSPDNERIAFASDGVIYVMNAAGGAKEKIAGELGPDAEPVNSPVWSPDGKHIVFERGTSVTDPFGGSITSMSILLVDPDGSHEQVLVKETRFEFPPIWAPDGTQVLFQRDASSQETQDLEIRICLSTVADRANTCPNRGGAIELAAAWQPLRT